MKILQGFTAHYVLSNCDAILSKLNSIYYYNYEKDEISKLLTLGYDQRIKNILKNDVIMRLLRSEIFHILIPRNEIMIVFFDNKIYKINNNEIVNIYKIPTCRRPLNVLYHKDKNLLIWGDYINTKNRKPISIYKSEDIGSSWTKIYTFPMGSIEHIHNIQFDNYRKCYWILTGDKDEESGIWRTKEFNKIEPFLIGKQMFRTVEIIIEEEGIIVPSDTEKEENYIRYYSFKKEEMINLKKVNGSCMYAKKIKDRYFVSTMYEPNKKEKSKSAELWMSKDMFNWERILSFKKDRLPVKYFQYPIIKIPEYSYNDNCNKYYFSTRSIKNGKRTLIVNINKEK